MAFLSNLHTHTVFSDGKNTVEEYVQAAIDKGFVSLGFSEHGYTHYDGDCCIKQEQIPVYLAEVERVKGKYRDQIEIYAGFESDYFQPADKREIDFAIGSVHYIHDRRDGSYNCIDYQHEKYQQSVEACGGIEEMIRTYYGMVLDMAKSYRPHIIGHLDLVEKLNEGNRYFDPASRWYQRIRQQVADGLAVTGCIVEANTGCISRGYRKEPMPAAAFLAVLCNKGVPVTISSDAHAVEHLDFAFEETAALLRDAGYRTVKQLRLGSFVDIPL